MLHKLQVDFIDIKNISIGICQNPCFKRTLSFADSRFNVQCTYHAVFRSADRKFHHFHGEHFYRRFFMVVFFMAFIAPVGPVIGVALVELLREGLSASTEYWYGLLGVIFILCTIYLPEGVAGLGRKLWRR